MITQVQDTVDLYIKAIDLAKEKEGLMNQDKMILNRFKILLRSDAADVADKEYARVGKVYKSTLHRVREQAESIFEDWVRHLDIADAERDGMLYEGKRRADFAEEYFLTELKRQGKIIE